MQDPRLDLEPKASRQPRDQRLVAVDDKLRGIENEAEPQILERDLRRRNLPRPQIVYRRLDLAPRLLAHAGAAVQNPVDRRGADVGGIGDLLDRGTGQVIGHAGSSFLLSPSNLPPAENIHQMM